MVLLLALPFTDQQGSRKILALCLSEDASCFGHDELQRLRNLRFLEWKGIKVHGNLKDVFSRLVWFSWHFCPTEFTATGMNLERLVMLELLRSNIDENWAGWTNMQVLKVCCMFFFHCTFNGSQKLC